MTNKDNGCVGSYTVSGYTRGDGISVSSYTRTCGAAHNSSTNTTTSTPKQNLTDEEKMQRRANILYPNMDKELGEMTGGASNLFHNANKIVPENLKESMYETAIENINNHRYLKERLVNEFGVEAVENLHMSKTECYLNTDYVKEYVIFNNYKEVNSDLQDYFKDKITEQLELHKVSSEVREEILNSTKGIYIDAESDSSKRLSETLIKEPKFVELLTSSIREMKNGASVESSLQFTDENFYNALGKADIKSMHINKQGNIDLLITDVYDFNPNSKNKMVKVGRKLQEEGKITPYFIMYHVIIPRDRKIN